MLENDITWVTSAGIAATTMSCVTKWLRSSEKNYDSRRFCDLAPALAVQITKRMIRTASPGGPDDSILNEDVQSLSLLLKVTRRLSVEMSSGGPLALKPNQFYSGVEKVKS